MGFGEASHRDWLETQACCWEHQKQRHCADRQLVQLQDKGPADAQPPTSLHPCSQELGPKRRIPTQRGGGGEFFCISSGLGTL